MTPLEQMLRAAAADAKWPATPDIAAALVPRIGGVTPRQIGDTAADPAVAGHPTADAHAPARGRGGGRIRVGVRRPLVIAVAALLVLAGSALAIPAVRDWLGLSTVEVKRVPKPLPAPRGAGLALGTHVSLDAARSKLGFVPVLPTGIGAPTVYYDGFPPGGQLGLVYAHGIVVSEVEGHLSTFIRKFLPPGTTMDRMTIDGQRALWIHGALHQYAYEDKTGRIVTDSVRTAGNVLLWRHKDLLVRIEGARSKQQAARIVRSAREAP